ncbi:hydroxyisourate hydrolase [Pseudomonas oryzihabitans]|uniref:hydroxyisourate hydrolase n=1 Tax=Pseudomonas oryzihabitans TaxID=47885 RepID=UPI00285BE6D6|nr:hydroxyisourate hydrolase [Pseudomonas psychrotolerans]MDR6677665.1 5-hydroxyisourate hydrolase [Pseudomonas psychrotolerans]
MKTFVLLAALALPGLAVAAPNPLSVHVLNLETGVPSAGVHVTLERQVGESWQPLAEEVTNAQGRVPALFPEDQTFAKGEYRVVFKTGDYYRQQGRSAFFPEIPVVFEVTQPAQHYHIPLLLSPYGFSTYRGS